jgi:ABC-2 type transport system ATP-binding protein
MSFIEVKNISKSYKINKRKSGLKEALKSFLKTNKTIIKAVDDISFSIEEGEIVGYIGPNGAGKSTTIKILSGILYPDSGECIVDSMNPFDDRQKYVAKIGVVFGQKSQLWWDIPVGDSFDLLKDIYKVDHDEYLETKKELIEAFDLKDIIETPVRQLSLGQRMRAEIAAALIHKPKILFLDEPTIGLDAVSKFAVRNIIKDINLKRKVTIILTTHDMADIEALAKRVILIGNGKILYDGSLSAIKKSFLTFKILEIYFDKLEKDLNLIGTEIIEKNDNKILINVDLNKQTVSNVISEYSKVCDIKDINVYEDNIEKVIVKLYKEYKI